MRKVLVFCLAAVMVACGSKKKSDDIITERVERPQLQEPIRQSSDLSERDVKWLGRTYHVVIERMPSDSLPLVSDETGQQFVDNVITLRISRPDGSVFLNKRFTKGDFAQYLDADYRTAGILEGMVFDEVDDDKLEFAASVSLPQTDEYIPLELKVSRMGDIAVKRDADMDTHGDDD